MGLNTAFAVLFRFNTHDSFTFKTTIMRRILAFLLSCSLLSASAQSIGEVDLKEINNYGLRKLDGAPKKIYISQFRFNFQTLYLDKERKVGGFRGGSEYTRSYKSDVQANLSIGLKGLQEQDLIDIVNDAYKDLTDKVKAAGYELVPTEAAAATSPMEGWERKAGGTLNQSQFDGYVTVSPTGYEYLVRATKDDGKEKGGFLSKAQPLSKELGGAIVLTVNISVPFAQEAESAGSKLLGRLGGGAKVVAETGLQIGNNALNTTGLMAGGSDGSTVFALNAKQSMANINVGNWFLKKPIEIGDVIEKKKFKSEETAKVDWGTDAGFFRVYDVDNRFMSKVHAVEVNAAKYKAGVLAAAKKYMDAVWAEIASNLK
ncbi:MAG TPA: hypothetical protein DIW54_10500 [Chitinophagaceae bacterium]|nr:hypothetical protein [Chitinophagaceae bacterium]